MYRSPVPVEAVAPEPPDVQETAAELPIQEEKAKVTKAEDPKVSGSETAASVQEDPRISHLEAQLAEKDALVTSLQDQVSQLKSQEVTRLFLNSTLILFRKNSSAISRNTRLLYPLKTKKSPPSSLPTRKKIR